MSTEWDGELQTMFQMGFGQVSRATPLMEGSFNTCMSQLWQNLSIWTRLLFVIALLPKLHDRITNH
jgi:hypothetical protein